MERSRKLTLTDWTKANDALNLHFEGNKSKLTKHLDMSRTTITAFFNQKPVREAEFRKICGALRLNWQKVSAVETIAPTQNEDWIEEVRSRCCKKILYQHSTIQLLNQTEIGVDRLYVDVWLLDGSPRAFQPGLKMMESFDLRNDRLGLGDRIKRNEGMAVAHDNARLLILGKPGAGKTTFLKHLAVDCSNGKFQPNLIPVLIELRKIQSTEWRLLDALSEELSTDNQRTQTLLEQGRLLILMDGLDEVPTNSFRRNVQEQLRSLAQERKHSGNRFILTCRTQIIEVIPQGFTSVEVAEFKDEQVENFVRNWFCASGQTEAGVEQQWQAFSDSTKHNSALKELTVTPVLLSLMCWVFQDSGELPSQATLLYRKGIRLLLEKWNDRKEIPEWEIGKEVYRELSIDQKEALLTEIAAQKFENSGNFVLFEEKDLAKQIANFLNLANVREGEAVLKAMEAQHGLLVERADELWSFSHLTFQEYFTARQIKEQHDNASLQKLASHVTEKHWHGVFRLTAEMLPNADRLLLLMKKKVDERIKDKKLQEFLAWLEDKACSISETSYKPASVRAFYFYFDRLRFNTLEEFLHPLRDNILAYEIDPHFRQDMSNCYSQPPTSFIFTFLPKDITIDLALARILDDDIWLPWAVNTSIPYILGLESTTHFKLELQFLINLLPSSATDWSPKNWGIWRKQLHSMMIRNCNIGHDWQFTQSQEQALERYYDANTFLVELLKQDGAVSESVCQEIEDNLLLPIAELKRRLPDLYS